MCSLTSLPPHIRREPPIAAKRMSSGGSGHGTAISVPIGHHDSVLGFLHPAQGITSGTATKGTAVILLSGAGGGTLGPSHAYPALSEDLAGAGITALRLDYREPARIDPCLEDVRAAIDYLTERGVSRVGVCGWSFGAAPALQSGQLWDEVVAVATVAAQTAQVGDVRLLSRKSPPVPVLFLHGNADTCLSYRCSQSLYSSAGEPKELVLVPGGDHGLTQAAPMMRGKLFDFFKAALVGASKQSEKQTGGSAASGGKATPVAAGGRR